MKQEHIEAREVRDGKADAAGIGIVLAAFGLGLVAGAVVTLLTAPESGEAVRRRVKRGMESARGEFEGVVEEAKESWNRVRDEAQEGVKRTTSKIKEAAKIAKDALVEKPPQVPMA